jgi:hypothetical protein
VIRREHRRVAQRQDVLEHRFIGLGRAHSLPARVEPPPQYIALPFRPLQALGENVPVAKTLFEFGAKPPAAGEMADEITNEPPEPRH